MGSIEKRVRDGKVTYLARWRDDQRRQRKRSFPRKIDADRFLASVEGDLVRGQYVDPSDKTTVIEYARTWAAGRAHRETTARRVSGQIETHIAGTSLGNRRLAAVVPSEVQAWAADRARVLAPSTLRNLVSLLRSIYAAAVLDRLVGRSPVVRIQLPSPLRKRLVPLTIAQVRALARAMPVRNRAMVIVQAGLGLRIGELLALREQDVDLVSGVARVEWQFAPNSKVRTDPKTPRSRRTVPLPCIVAEAVQEHSKEYPPAEDGTLFNTRFSGPYRHDYYGSQIFGAAVRKAGLPTGTTTHDLPASLRVRTAGAG